jgi:hypothetical protein
LKLKNNNFLSLLPLSLLFFHLLPFHDRFLFLFHLHLHHLHLLLHREK